MSSAQQTEVWQRGPVPGFDPLLMPVVHALIQVREDLDRLASQVPPEHVWLRPGGAASIGFHVRHTGGALDRLFTYARGETLSDVQKTTLRDEGAAGDPSTSLASVVTAVNAIIDRALEQLAATPRESFLDERKLGRAGVPTNVLGLLFHAAEHSTRHMGQAITTAKIVASLRDEDSTARRGSESSNAGPAAQG
jgi:DinB superfamily